MAKDKVNVMPVEPGGAPVSSKKPFGFYVTALSFSFERCAFYTVKYMLAVWIATTVGGGGLGLTTAQAASMSALFVAWTYITPVIGGYLADYWIPPRIAVPIGMILMGVGYLMTWQANSIGMVWAMIILVSIGTGLFKGNLSGITGLLFNDERQLDEAFSIQYTFVNLGSFIGTTFLVLLIPKIGFKGVFLICAILLFLDCVWFLVNSRALGDAGKKPFKVDQRQFIDPAKKEAEANQPLSSTDKKRVFAIVLVTIFSIVFWAAWYLAYMPAYYYFGYGDGAGFIERANWMLGSFKVPTSYFDSTNALVCMALGPILGKLWTKLAARPQGDMSMFKKTALGIILLGLTYVMMVLVDKFGGGNPSFLWIMAVGVIMTIGEMVFSPLGNSFISKLAPSKLMGLLLGLWPIAVFFSNMIYPKIYAMLETDVPAQFQKGYGILAAVILVMGLILWFSSGKLDELEKGE